MEGEVYENRCRYFPSTNCSIALSLLLFISFSIYYHLLIFIPSTLRVFHTSANVDFHSLPSDSPDGIYQSILSPYIPNDTVAIASYTYENDVPKPIIEYNVPISGVAKQINVSSLKSKKFAIYEVMDSFINCDQFRIVGKEFIGNGGFCSNIHRGRKYSFKGHFSGSFDLVIALGNSHTQNFGHFFLDFLPFVQLLTPSFLENGNFIFPELSSFHRDTFNALNVPYSHIHIVPHENLVFAHRAVFMSPRPCLSDVYGQFIELSQRLLKFYGVTNYTPEVKVIYDRESPPRIIKNLLEVLEMLQCEVVESECWKIIGNFNTMSEAALEYGTIAMHFSIHGSVFPNFLFMKKGAVLIEIRTRESMLRHNIGYQIAAFALGLPHILIPDMSQSRSDAEVDVDIGRSLVAVKKGFDILADFLMLYQTEKKIY